MRRQRIVILGAGFGGLFAYRRLLKKKGDLDAEITIVNESDNFVFTPMLSEYLTGEIDESNVQQPLGSFINPESTTLVVDKVLAIDAKNRQVKTSQSNIQYDFLVIALGSRTNYYGITGAQEFSQTYTSLADVTKIRRGIDRHVAVSQTAQNKLEGEALLSIAIVGAGPRGCELAAKVQGLAMAQAKNLDNVVSSPPRVYLIDTHVHLLPQLHRKLSYKATQTLTKQGVVLKTGSKVTKLTDGTVHLAGDESLPAQMVIWVAGVVPALPKIGSIKLSKQTSQIIVDRKLRAVSVDNVFALGDIATVDGYRKPQPTSAQVAVQQGKIVATNIIKSIKKQELTDYNYSPIGMVIPLGRWKGVGQIGSFRISGPLVWLSCKVVYVLRFPIQRKRLPIAWHWLLEVLT